MKKKEENRNPQIDTRHRSSLKDANHISILSGRIFETISRDDLSSRTCSQLENLAIDALSVASSVHAIIPACIFYIRAACKRK